MDSSPAQRQLRMRFFQLALGVTLSVVSLYFVIQQIDWQLFWSSLLQTDVPYLAMAFCSVLVNQCAKAWRWQWISHQQSGRLPFRRAIDALMIGQWFNALFPFRVGDLARAITAGEKGGQRSFLLGGIGIEKFLDFAILLLGALIMLFIAPLPIDLNSWVTGGLRLILIVTLLFCVLLLSKDMLTSFLRRVAIVLPERLESFLVRMLPAGLSSLDIFLQKKAFLMVILFSAFVWLTAWLNIYLLMLAMDLQLPWNASVWLLILLLAGISLPSAPVKIGVFEFVGVFTLGFFGMARTEALSFMILLHVLVYTPVMFVGLILVIGEPGLAQFLGEVHEIVFRNSRVE